MTRRFNSFILFTLSSCRRQQPPGFGSFRERAKDRTPFRVHDSRHSLHPNGLVEHFGGWWEEVYRAFSRLDPQRGEIDNRNEMFFVLLLLLKLSCMGEYLHCATR